MYYFFSYFLSFFISSSSSSFSFFGILSHNTFIEDKKDEEKGRGYHLPLHGEKKRRGKIANNPEIFRGNTRFEQKEEEGEELA